MARCLPCERHETSAAGSISRLARRCFTTNCWKSRRNRWAGPAARWRPRWPRCATTPAERAAAVLKAAADAVWGFLVQREIMGLRDRAAVIALYDIPREVLVRIGAR